MSPVLRKSSRIYADSRGATAIEYAIIAALIGVGLIASLVTTRTSLGSIFGVASSQMASSDAGSGGGSAGGSSGTAPAIPAGPYSQKTVSKFYPVYQGEMNQYIYNFTDGTSLNRTVKFNSDGKITEQHYAFHNAEAGETLHYRHDGAGNIILAEWDRPGPSGTTYSYITSDNGQMTNAGGGVPNSTTAQSADFIAKINGLKGDVAYFAPLLTPTRQP